MMTGKGGTPIVASGGAGAWSCSGAHGTLQSKARDSTDATAVGRVARCRWVAGRVVCGCGLFQPG